MSIPDSNCFFQGVFVEIPAMYIWKNKYYWIIHDCSYESILLSEGLKIINPSLSFYKTHVLRVMIV